MRSTPRSAAPVSLLARWLGGAALLAALTLPTQANAQPSIVPLQGLLLDGGGSPIDGTVNVRLRVYDAPTAGSTLHDESVPTLAVEDGRFLHYLGQNAVLDLSMFDGAPKWLGVEVIGVGELTPRIEFGTVPYAAYAGEAGAVSWTNIFDVPAGIVSYGADAPLTLNAATNRFGLGSSACPVDGLWRWTGSNWICEALSLQNLTAGTGITIVGGQIRTDAPVCGAGQFARFTVTGWACDNDAVGITAIVPGNGIGVAGTTVSTVADTCGAGQYSYWNGTAWRCRADTVGTTNLVGANGIQATESAGVWTIRTSSPTCSAAQRSWWDGNAWQCGTDQAGLTSLTAGTGITITGSGSDRTIALSAQSQFGQVPIGSVVAWTNHVAGTPALPAGWVRCDGQVLSDAASPMNGQTIPNLNGGRTSQVGVGTRGLFLRGHSSSGEIESDQSNHFDGVEQSDSNQGMTQGVTGVPVAGWSGWVRQFYTTSGGDSHRFRNAQLETRPVNMSVVWIMRVK